MIGPDVLNQLLNLGRLDQLDDPHLFDSLPRSTDLSTINTVYWTEWRAATAALNEEDMVALVKTLTIVDKYFPAGSVAGVVWVYNILEDRNPELAHSLDKWIRTRTNNPYADFEARRTRRVGKTEAR